ncbi:MAG: universal stress protein [Chloroflexota bacterium]
MYRHIMAPLDGSQLAECVLPHAEAIAGGCSVPKVSLVRVVTPVRLYQGVETRLSPDELRRVEADSEELAVSYLRNLVKGLKFKVSQVEYEVLKDEVAEQLVNFAANHEVDLIIISTHGRSGVSRWVWGSVADRILRSASVPVLMVRAPGCPRPS